MKRINLLLVCLVVMLLAFPVIKLNVSAQGTYISVSPTGAERTARRQHRAKRQPG